MAAPLFTAGVSALLKLQRATLANIGAHGDLEAAMRQMALAIEAMASIRVGIAIVQFDERQQVARAFAPGFAREIAAKLSEWMQQPQSERRMAAVLQGKPVCQANGVEHEADSFLDACWPGWPVRSRWMFPSVGSSETVNGFVLCALSENRAPSPADKDALELTAHIAAMAMERARFVRSFNSTQARYRQIFDSATDFAIIGCDLAGIVTEWNKGAESIFGWTRDELIKRPIHRIFTPEDVEAQRPETELRLALVDGYAPNERWHVRKDGKRFWASGSMMPLKDHSNNVVGFIKIVRDRTAHKTAEDRLAKMTVALEVKVAERTRERDRIWRNSMDLLLVIATDGTLLAANPAAATMLGYESGELIGHTFHPVVHPDDIGATLSALATAATGPLQRLEIRLRHKNGSYRWFAWRAAPEDGVIYANGRDITVEKRQADQLQQVSEARMNLALEAGEMGVWQWNPSTNTIMWLQGAAAVHGIDTLDPLEPIEIPLDQYLERHVFPDDHALVSTALERAFTDTTVQREEFRIVWPDGRLQWIECRGQMFRDEMGIPSQMVGVSVNITKRKQIEQDLKFVARASAELAGLVDTQSTLDRLAFLAVPFFADWCAVDLVEPDGTLRRVAVAHSDRRKAQLAHEIHRRFPPDPRLQHGVWSIIRSGKPQYVREITQETLHRFVGDSERRAIMQELGMRSYIGVPLATHGKIYGAVTFISAESGRLYTEADVELAEDLAHRAAVAIDNAELYRAARQSDQAKNVFLATLSHELRNPLAAIVSGIGMMQYAAGDPARVGQYTALLERQARQLTRLVDDLMDVSRITTGKIALKAERMNLVDIVTHAIEANRPMIEANRHRLSISVPDEPTELVADPARLAQVFSNLVSNAAKYTPPDGDIHVAVACLPEEYVVRVRDNGVGIAGDMLTDIFKIFTQVTHPIQRAQGGLGIGLSLVDGLVRLHGGRVEAKSAGVNQGSEFLVYLPRTASASPWEGGRPAEHFQALIPEGGKRRVLLVDDNADAGLSLMDIATLLGHEVEFVHDGLQAVEAARRMRPDLIVLDIGLPGMDGYEVARRIRALPEIPRSTVLVALTGWGQEKDRQQAFEAGFDHHLVKPVSMAQFRALLGEP